MADLREAWRAFTTTVALITTEGPKGPNVMAAEWTFNVSYEPFLIAVLVGPENATFEAIEASKEFGVNLVSEEQVAAMAFAGHFSKSDTDKLSSMFFDTYPAKTIKVPMIKGALLNAECRLVQQVVMGDHTAFVGEVIEFTWDPSKQPIVLHRGAHRLGDRLLRGPGIVVAATPMRARSGQTITVAGELTGPDRSAKPLEVSVIDSGGREVARGSSVMSGGYFEGIVQVPEGLAPGAYRVVARAGVLQGEARLEIE